MNDWDEQPDQTDQRLQRLFTKTDRAVLFILGLLVLIFVLLCVTFVNVRWDKTW